MSSDAINVVSDLVRIGASTVERYLPEPAVKGVGLFRDAMELAQTVVSDEVGGVPSEALGDFAELIQFQIDVQREMQTVNMVSNIEKSKHESKMAPIRNIRVS